VRTATKKAGGSSKNGRKTAGRRLGLKRHDGEKKRQREGERERERERER
jgi:large subunit ribosomal protein L27